MSKLIVIFVICLSVLFITISANPIEMMKEQGMQMMKDPKQGMENMKGMAKMGMATIQSKMQGN